MKRLHEQIRRGTAGLCVAFAVLASACSQQAASPAAAPTTGGAAPPTPPPAAALVAGFITQKVDALVFAPAGPKEMIPTIQSANQAGIPVICVDRGAEGGQIATTSATDNLEGARLGAEYLGKFLKAQGKGD